ncbi:hypothetical protein Tco_0489889 [Tanacetum coccineum]
MHFTLNTPYPEASIRRIEWWLKIIPKYYIRGAHHNEKFVTLIELTRLTFSDEEKGDKAKTNDKRNNEEKDEDLHKPYKEVLKSTFTRRIIKFSTPNHQMPTNFKMCDGSTDPDDLLASWERPIKESGKCLYDPECFRKLLMVRQEAGLTGSSHLLLNFVRYV